MDCKVPEEELAAYAANDVDPLKRAEMEGHVVACVVCRERLEAIRRVDTALAYLPRYEPGLGAELELRRVLAGVVRPAASGEVMTLEEVAEFLRVGPGEMDVIAESLPAFEIGGRVRVRRSRLLEWIEERERAYRRGSVIATLALPKAWPLQEGVAS